MAREIGTYKKYQRLNLMSVNHCHTEVLYRAEVKQRRIEVWEILLRQPADQGDKSILWKIITLVEK